MEKKNYKELAEEYADSWFNKDKEEYNKHENWYDDEDELIPGIDDYYWEP